MTLTPIPNELLRFRVAGDHGTYLVDLAEHDFTGQCDCKNWQCVKWPLIKHGIRGEEGRCRHIRFAREWLLDDLLPRLVKRIS